MFPLLFLAYVVAIKVFKKATPNGKLTHRKSIFRVKYLLRLSSRSVMLTDINIKIYYLGKLTVYLGKRDFIDHLDYTDPIDGVVVVENDYLQGRRVFGQVSKASRNKKFAQFVSSS